MLLLFFINLSVALILNMNFKKHINNWDKIGYSYWIKKNVSFYYQLKKVYIPYPILVKYAWLSIWYNSPRIIGKIMDLAFKVIPFWQQRTLYYFLIKMFNFASLQNKFFWNHNYLCGMKLKLKGKVAVGGNSRKRTLYYKVGMTGYGNYSTNLTYSMYASPNVPGTVTLQLYFFKIIQSYYRF